MRKIRIMAHISLDGVISPGGPNEDSDYAHGGWTAPYRTPAGAAAVAEAQGKSFDLLLGRRTYDLWAGFWPKAGNSPIADGLNAATKYVATHRPDSLEWGPVGDLGADIMLQGQECGAAGTSTWSETNRAGLGPKRSWLSPPICKPVWPEQGRPGYEGLVSL
jgi:hypothetical protein